MPKQSAPGPGCPAQILAVTRLMIDVLERMEDRDMEFLSPVEAEFAVLLIPHMEDLRRISAQAKTEMQALPLPLLEGYPAPG